MENEKDKITRFEAKRNYSLNINGSWEFSLKFNWEVAKYLNWITFFQAFFNEMFSINVSLFNKTWIDSRIVEL